MSKFVEVNDKIAEKVVEGYKKIENGVVEGFGKVTDKCVDVLFAKAKAQYTPPILELTAELSGQN